MAARSLTERIEILEQKVGDLQELPARMVAVESQILQLRGEMRDGFSAIHARLGTHDQRFDAMDQRFDAMDQRFDAMDQRFDAMDKRFDGMDERFVFIVLRLDEIKNHMLVLHEDALNRISVTREAPPARNGRGRRKR